MVATACNSLDNVGQGFFSLTRPQFPLLQNGDYNSNHLIGLLWELNKLMEVLTTVRTYGKYWLLAYVTRKQRVNDEVWTRVGPQGQNRGPRRGHCVLEQWQSLHEENKTAAEVVVWVGWGQAKTSSGRNSITKTLRRKLAGTFVITGCLMNSSMTETLLSIAMGHKWI